MSATPSTRTARLKQRSTSPTIDQLISEFIECSKLAIGSKDAVDNESVQNLNRLSDSLSMIQQQNQPILYNNKLRTFRMLIEFADILRKTSFQTIDALSIADILVKTFKHILPVY